MSEDPYEILSVAKDASDDQIRTAYRDLAKKYHPDLNPGDDAAEEKFKEVSGAFEILGDADKRAKFDRGEIDASGAETPERHYYRDYAGADPGYKYRTSGGYEDAEDLGAFFSDLFGGGAGRAHAGGDGGFRIRGADVHYHLDVTFLDAVNGTKTRVTMPDGKSLDITVPPGLRDSQILRLKGKGHSGVGGGPSGDAMVQVSVKPHREFKRDGNDIRIDLPVALPEAVLGGRIEVPTISGSVKLTVPEGSNTGTVLRIKGKGIKPKGAKKAGDQLVRLRVVLPDQPDEALKTFLKGWAADRPYSPRDKAETAS